MGFCCAQSAWQIHYSVKNRWFSVVKKQEGRFRQKLGRAFIRLEKYKREFKRKFSKEQARLIERLYEKRKQMAEANKNTEAETKPTQETQKIRKIDRSEMATFEVSLEFFENEEKLNWLIQMVRDKKASTNQNLEILDFIAANRELVTPSKDLLKVADVKNSANCEPSIRPKETPNPVESIEVQSKKEESKKKTPREIIFKIPIELPFDFWLKSQANYGGGYPGYNFRGAQNSINLPGQFYPNYYYPPNNYQFPH